MSVADRDSVDSQLIITFQAIHHLDRKYVVFGKLVQRNEVLKKIENVGDEEGIPTVTVKIINCGEVSEEKRKNKLKMGKDASSEADSHEVRRKEKHKKSSRDKRKKRITMNPPPFGRLLLHVTPPSSSHHHQLLFRIFSC
ncbi:hypothetical protein CRYUN_Cryun01aG0078500 [Craigia yunnanensis]